MRPSLDVYWLSMAALVSTRATCPRKHVGAVIVSPDKLIVSTGYNGSPAGMPHCDDPKIGCEMKEIEGRMSCVRTLHAESNALDQAGKNARGCILYCTVTPCYQCAKRIVNAGIRRVVCSDHYDSQHTGLVPTLFDAAAIQLDYMGGVA